MRIADRDVRNAVEIIIEELQNAEVRIAELEARVAAAEGENDTLAVENERLLNDVAELSDEVKRLDDALADTYISQLDPKSGVRGEPQ